MNESIFMANPQLYELRSYELFINGNIIVNGWLLSWTTLIFGSFLIGLIIWNIYLTIKLRNSSKGEEAKQ